MFILLLLSAFLQDPSPTTVTVRIVGDPESPVVLVGNACSATGAPEVLARVVEPAGQLASDVVYGPFQSEPFFCPGTCDIGFRVRTARQIESIQLGRIHLRERGRLYSLLLPPLPPGPAKELTATLKICNGEYLFPIWAGSTTFPIEVSLFYVAGVKFADGSAWELQARDEFIKRMSDAWRRAGR